MWNTSVYSSGNVHSLKLIRPTIPHDTPRYPTIPHGGILGGFRGSTIQKPGKCGQTAGPIGNTFCTYNADESGNGHMLNKWGSGTWYPLDVAPGDETEHIIAQACKMARKTSTPMQIMCYEKK